MSITSKTKRLGMLAGAYFICVVVVVVAAIVTIRAKQVTYESLRTTYHEQQAKLLSAQAVEQTLTVSEADRKELASYFLRDWDVITLLTVVEQRGRRAGLRVETTQLAVTPATDKTQSQLKVGFSYNGEYDRVIEFTKWLETIPYHKMVTDVSLGADQGGDWQGSILMSITLLQQ
jgi:Tfp pilus assembly protein PilO